MSGAAFATSPRRIGRYLLLDVFASGGMATIHFGRQLGDAGASRVVAIKRLHPHLAREPEFVAMFADEARLSMRVQHPNVAGVLDVVASDSELLIVMEYIPGAPLARFVAPRGASPTPMPLGVASAVISDLLLGLHAAHEATDESGAALGLVHRDVSPHNVLLGTDGVARVIDFGVAKAQGRLQVTRTGDLKGKIAYMAPEQLRAREATVASDVYSASVVLWECLTGRRMVLAEQEAAIEQILLGDLDPPSRFAPGLPREVDDVVLRGLSPEPSGRWASAREMAGALQAAAPRATAMEVSGWVNERASPEIARLAEQLRSLLATPESGVNARSCAGLEVHLALPAAREALEPAAHWRSTWVVSSLQTLKERGHFERYRALLPASHHADILMAVAGVWLPMSIARVHYETCGALGLSLAEQLEMGRLAGARAQGTVLRTAVALASAGGVTPWAAFSHMQRLWERGADGGGAAVYKIGPSEALLETVGCELFDVPYFRAAFGSTAQGVVNMFCSKSYVHDLTPAAARGECLLRFQWA